MNDPHGPDPNDPADAERKVGKVVPVFEASSPVPGSTAPLKPRVRHANYDSPEALFRPEAPTIQGKSVPMPVAEKIHAEPVQVKPAEPLKPAAPVTPPVASSRPATPLPPARPTQPAPRFTPPPKQQPAPDASTALARPIPPRPGKLQRAVGIAKTMLPIVGNLLPLLEGNVVGAASNLIANRGGNEFDLKPLHEAIASLQSDQRALTFHSGEQKRALQRLEDEFTTLQDSVQKQAADQAELAEQVVKLAKRTSTFMRLVTILLVLSILATTALVVRIAYIIRF